VLTRDAIRLYPKSDEFNTPCHTLLDILLARVQTVLTFVRV